MTSATGAALRDILRTLAARYPLVDVILAAAPVQGADVPPGIVAALDALNRWAAEREPLDVILLARGGGSVEDLWAFNDERVARAIVASAVPVITGVGHETDFTIADFAADLRVRCLPGPRTWPRPIVASWPRPCAGDGGGANANSGAPDRSAYGDGCPDASAGPSVPPDAHRA